MAADGALERPRPALVLSMAALGAGAIGSIHRADRTSEVARAMRTNAPFVPAFAPNAPSNAPFPRANAPFPGMNAPFPGMNAPFPGMNAPFPGMNDPFSGTNAPFPGMNAPNAPTIAPNPATNAPNVPSFAPSMGTNGALGSGRAWLARGETPCHGPRRRQEPAFTPRQGQFGGGVRARARQRTDWVPNGTSGANLKGGTRLFVDHEHAFSVLPFRLGRFPGVSRCSTPGNWLARLQRETTPPSCASSARCARAAGC
jgi:hypothetical protein